MPHIELPNHLIFITCSCHKTYRFSEKDKNILFNSIIFHDKKKYILHAAVVMDTHFHIIIECIISLTEIIHSIKSYSSHEINKINKRVGNIWMRSYFDRIIRDENDYLIKINYIINNPVKVGLENYKWLYVMYDV